MEVKIIKKVSKPFKGNDGEEIMYFWYTALRQGDGVTIQFGSPNEYEEAETISVNLEKREGRDGKIRYMEARN